MLSEEGQSIQEGRGAPGRRDSSNFASRNVLAQLSQTSQVKTMKYVTNQLLDKDGQLLTEH